MEMIVMLAMVNHTFDTSERHTEIGAILLFIFDVSLVISLSLHVH
jgi:hypothetical protein